MNNGQQAEANAEMISAFNPLYDVANPGQSVVFGNQNYLKINNVNFETNDLNI